MYDLKVCVFFFASLKLLVQYFSQSVLLRQSFEFRWNNQIDFSFSLSRNFGYQLLRIICESFAFKKLFIRLDSSMGTWPTNIFCSLSDGVLLSRQLQFCCTPLPHHVCLSLIVPCYHFCESSLIVKKHSSIVPCYRFCESMLIVN